MSEQTITGWKSALTRLKDGNKRFVTGQSTNQPIENKKKLEELAEKGQFPYAIILTCADSRVPAELVFDEGVGDLFVIRVAGNVAQPSQIASIEYAVANLGVTLVSIIGHSKCGAVKAAVDCESTGGDPGSKSLRELVDMITPAVKNCKSTSDANNILTNSIQENVKLTREMILEQSPILRDKQDSGDIELVEGYFDMGSGIVNFKNSPE